jgi:hypothetical protein
MTTAFSLADSTVAAWQAENGHEFLRWCSDTRITNEGIPA